MGITVWICRRILTGNKLPRLRLVHLPPPPSPPFPQDLLVEVTRVEQVLASPEIQLLLERDADSLQRHKPSQRLFLLPKRKVGLEPAKEVLSP
jgi:hypothetical protein